jgi:integrase
MIVPVRELTSERMQVEINIMAASKSPKTVRNAYGLITAALAMFAPEIHLRVTLPKKKQIEYNVPTTEQIYTMLDHASENLTTAIMLAAFCGLRRGEIAALTSDDVSDNVIHVKAAAVRGADGKLTIKAPKTYTSDRYIPIPSFVYDHIKDKRGRVCPIALNSITRRFEELREKLGYTCRFHDLRHYYASSLHAIGVQDEYIMRFGGWKSDAVLKSVYRGTLTDFERDSADKITAYFDKNANEMLTKC